MMRRNFRHSKKSGDVTLPLEFDRLSHIYKEFTSSAEIQSLLKQKRAIYEEIGAALPEGLKSLILGYSDINDDIAGRMIKFFYKYDLLDRTTITQLLRGKQKLKLDIHIL